MTDVEAGDGTSWHFEFTETRTEGYVSKMKNVCSGVLIGFLLFFGSVGLLVSNEVRTVKRAKDIDEGRVNVVQVDLNSFSNVSSLPADYENELIYSTGNINTDMAAELLQDPIFGVSTGDTSPLKIKRSVEMYQWREVAQETNTARPAFVSSLIDSTRFRDENANKYKNPTSFPFDSLVLEADPIFLDNLIEVSKRVIDRFNWYEPFTVALDDVPDASLRANLTVYTNSGFYYSGANDGTLTASAVGDARITFEAVVEPDIISIIAQVKKGSASSNSNSNYNLDSYTTRRGNGLLLVKRGTFTSEELFTEADEENMTMAWIFRGVGILLMFASIFLMLRPLVQGGLEKCIFPTVALLIAIPVSLFVIVLAWIAYSPYIAVPILAVYFVLIVCLCMRARKAKQDDGENNNGSREDLKLKPDPYSSSNRNKAQFLCACELARSNKTTASTIMAAEKI
jgi:uncharacterized membrane protein YhaH (DUF805 family)